ncbi:hypothetical protein ABMA84_15735 [Halobacteriovorax sp. XZX-2]|uniref:hypothetical protein n=1 Tax=unclassified Halobacteriovorax TaxID=2639665 RepID=UPI003716C22A
MVVTGNGTYALQIGANWSATALYPTALGGATAVLQVNGVDLVDGTLADNTQLVITHGKRAVVKLVVTNYTADFEVETYEV